MDAIVFGAARGDDDDRCADSFGARCLDHAPAVALRKHQIEHHDVGTLEAQAGEALLALADHHGVEPGRGEMPCHALGDDAVVFDDQDFGHTRLE